MSSTGLQEIRFILWEGSIIIDSGQGSVTNNQIKEFIVIKKDISHNAIFGRPMLEDLRVIILIYHFSIKFPTSSNIGCVIGCQFESQECYNKAIQAAQKVQNFAQIEGKSEKDSIIWIFDKELVKFEKATCSAIMIVEFPEELLEAAGGSTTNVVDVGSCH